jgi:hypothetical protein
MFTALVFVGGAFGSQSEGAADQIARTVMQTLNALIPAVVEGLVRELVIMSDDDDQRLAALADQCGCGLARTLDLETILRNARCEWVLALKAGSVPESGWQEAIEAVFADNQQDIAQAFRFRRSPLSPKGLVAKLFAPDHPLDLGMVAKRSALLAQKGGMDARSRALKPKPIAAFTRVANARPSAA